MYTQFLLCCSGAVSFVKSLKCFLVLTLADCQPSFTGSPNNGNPVYQFQGNSVTLSWFYNPDGRTVADIEWSFNVNQRIATKVQSTGVLNIDPAYTGRVEVSGSASLKLLNIQGKDSGKYQCRVLFTTFNPRRITDEAELIVVGKFRHLYFLFTLYRGILKF